jgi:hypothetical protein
MDTTPPRGKPRSQAMLVGVSPYWPPRAVLLSTGSNTTTLRSLSAPRIFLLGGLSPVRAMLIAEGTTPFCFAHFCWPPARFTSERSNRTTSFWSSARIVCLRMGWCPNSQTLAPVAGDRRPSSWHVDAVRGHHSITSSVRASSVGGSSRPSALAVIRLMTRSNLVGCSTGMSAGFAPRRILSTRSAARRNRSG